MAGLDVDHTARTIAGLVVPYGRIGVSQRRRWRFAPGWPSYGRVPLLRDHDQSQRLGRAVALGETLDGLYALFHLGAGLRADRTLALAADGTLGLSVGIDYGAGVVTADPRHQGVRLVVAAWIDEVSLTDDPVFDWGQP